MPSVDGSLRIARATAQLAAARARGRKLRPSYNWSYELLVRFLRLQAIDLAQQTVEDRRAALERVGAREKPGRRATFEAVTVGGVAAERVLSTKRAPGDLTLLYLHGGGYALGSPFSHRTLNAWLARKTRATVLSLDYRLAPEHPCPAAIDDVVAAYRALLDDGVAPERLVIGGDSAGGGLTVSSLCALRDAGLPLPSAALLLSPWMDLRDDADKDRQASDCDYLLPGNLAWACEAYAGDLPRDDPRVSPRFASLEGLPPLCIVAGGSELLAHDSVDLAARAREAGVVVELHVEADEIHVFPATADLNPRAKTALDVIASFVARHASGSAGSTESAPAA